jgi:vacuolar-type H+-ATPase subunit C/Vma6
MDRIGADAFVYAKACGLYARSWIGLRSRPLFAATRLQDLWALLYAEDVPLLPEGLLARQIERKSEERAVRSFANLLSAYDSCDPVSLALISRYEYANLKGAIAALSLRNTEEPYRVDIGRFSFINWKKWPDLAAMTRNTVVSWLDAVPEPPDLVAMEIRLDHQYYRMLWDALESLQSKDRASVEKLIREEIILQNIGWALRLRVYYGMDAKAIIPLLAHGNRDEGECALLSSPAVAILEKPLDAWDAWSAWKYAWLLNPHEEGVPWTVDPRWALLASDRYLYRLARAQFHQEPFTVGTLVSFFRIKMLEVQMIRVASEGLRLGADEGQMRDFLGDDENA